MSRKKKECIFLPWLTPNPNGYHDGESQYNKIPAALYQDARFQALRPSAQMLYQFMAIESRGQIRFKFSHGRAERYGLNRNTFDSCVKQLIRTKMIREIENEDRLQYATREFEFTPAAWKALTTEQFRALAKQKADTKTEP